MPLPPCQTKVIVEPETMEGGFQEWNKVPPQTAKSRAGRVAQEVKVGRGSLRTHTSCGHGCAQFNPSSMGGRDRRIASFLAAILGPGSVRDPVTKE